MDTPRGTGSLNRTMWGSRSVPVGSSHRSFGSSQAKQRKAERERRKQRGELEARWAGEGDHLPSGLGKYPLVMTNIAIENGHRNSEFSHSKW